jgi:hypothetical protein
VKSWMWPLVMVAIAVPIVAGFAIDGGAGLAVGSLTVVVLVLWAIRQRPRDRISPPAPEDGRRHLLLVVTARVEEPSAVAEIVSAGRLAGSGEGNGAGADAGADVLVLAPARIGFWDRWASDVEPARRAAQERLVVTVAALAKAGVEAEARVGDEDVVQAVEDQLQTYPATDVIFVSSRDDEGEDPDEGAAKELGERLAPEFRHLELATA